MRVLVTVEPSFPVPPEQMPAMLGAFAQWRERWRAKMESFYFFAGRSGGGGVMNTADETELSQMMMEFPFGPVSTINIQPIVDGDDALRRLTATMNTVLSQMKG